MATINLEDEMRQLGANGQYKISGIDVELKEKQFMNDEFEYYKEVKIKAKKKACAKDRNSDFLVGAKIRPRNKLFLQKK